MPAAWRLFFYLPFEHSEVLADQRRGLELLMALPPVPGRPGDGHMTRLHLDIVERFGRFPHRNAILGRVSTPAELVFLEECEHRTARQGLSYEAFVAAARKLRQVRWTPRPALAAGV